MTFYVVVVCQSVYRIKISKTDTERTADVEMTTTRDNGHPISDVPRRLTLTLLTKVELKGHVTGPG